MALSHKRLLLAGLAGIVRNRRYRWSTSTPSSAPRLFPSSSPGQSVSIVECRSVAASPHRPCRFPAPKTRVAESSSTASCVLPIPAVCPSSMPAAISAMPCSSCCRCLPVFRHRDASTASAPAFSLRFASVSDPAALEPALGHLVSENQEPILPASLCRPNNGLGRYPAAAPHRRHHFYSSSAYSTARSSSAPERGIAIPLLSVRHKAQNRCPTPHRPRPPLPHQPIHYLSSNIRSAFAVRRDWPQNFSSAPLRGSPQSYSPTSCHASHIQRKYSCSKRVSFRGSWFRKFLHAKPFFLPDPVRDSLSRST